MDQPQNTISRLKTILKHPGTTHRPLPILHYRFPRQPEEMDRAIRLARENGLGGFVVSMGASEAVLAKWPQEQRAAAALRIYLEEETEESEYEWRCLRSFVEKCLNAGLEIWIYDEYTFPSGGAGGKVLEANPDYQTKALFCHTAVTEAASGHLPLPAFLDQSSLSHPPVLSQSSLPHPAVLDQASHGPVRFLETAAYRYIDESTVDQNSRIPLTVTGNEIRWSGLPAGRWRICVIYTGRAGFITQDGIPYVDVMRSEVTDAFLEVTHKRYLKHLGEANFQKITAFFSDEPGFPVHGCSNRFTEEDAAAAWTDEMYERLELAAKEVEQRNGAAFPWVDIFYNTGCSCGRYRRIYWNLASELFTKNYIERIAEFLEEYGICLTGHLYGEETLSMQVGLNGDMFQAMDGMQMPGVDRLYSYSPRDIIPEKTAAGAAHLKGKPYVMSESSFHFEANDWGMPEQMTVENMINSAYYQAVLGINRIASYHPDEHRPAPEWKRYGDCISRAFTFCSLGRHVTDVLLLVPIQKAYERYRALDHKYWNVGPGTAAPLQSPSMCRLETAYGLAVQKLMDLHYDFDLISGPGLASCGIEEGRIISGYESFGVLLMFAERGEDLETLTEFPLRDWLESGGKLILLDPDGEGTDQIKYDSRLVFRYQDQVKCGTAKQLEGLLAHSAQKVLEVGGESEGIYIQKRVTADARLWFIENRENRVKETVIFLEDAAVLWDPDTGAWVHLPEGPKHVTVPALGACMLAAERPVHQVNKTEISQKQNKIKKSISLN